MCCREKISDVLSVRSYGSTLELADDLERYLKSKPIAARPVPLEQERRCRRDNPSMNWTGGKIDAGIDLGAQGATNVTTTISGVDGIKEILSGGFIFNAGTITLEDRAWIYMSASANIWNAGTFDIRGDDPSRDRRTIIGEQGQVTNTGTFKKTNSTGTTTIEAEFYNWGEFLLESGVVRFTGKAEQIGAGSLTRLNGGNLETTSTCYVKRGTLEGVGTITGNVTLDDPINPGNPGGELKPGVGNGPGTLNIVGNFTMGPNSILGINIDAAGIIGTLRVLGGSATLDGVLWVNRHPDYTPGVVGTTRTFMEYASVTGDFFHIEIYNNSWSTGQPRDPLFHFEPDKQATSYRLIVQAG